MALKKQPSVGNISASARNTSTGLGTVLDPVRLRGLGSTTCDGLGIASSSATDVLAMGAS